MFRSSDDARLVLPLRPQVEEERMNSIGDGESDAGLVARLLAGEDAAVAILEARFDSRFWYYARKFGRHEADDYYAEIVLKVFKALKRWRNPEPLDPFLNNVARNCAIDMVRWRLRRPEEPLPVSESDVLATPAEPIIAQMDVSRCFSQLEKRCRTMLGLSIDGFKPSEIAEIMSIPPDILYTRLNRCRARLRACLDAAAPAARRGAV